jgi:hypothetical protein
MLFVTFIADPRLGARSQTLLIFAGSDLPDWQEISAEFGAWTKENVVPPNVLIVVSQSHADHLIAQANDEEDGPVRYELLSKQSCVSIGGFDSGGRLAVVQAGSLASSATEATAQLHRAVNAFIDSEATNESVVVAAPLGFYFSKLSNRYSSHFLRAESLLKDSRSIELLALRLLPAFSEFCLLEKSAEKVRILVDSMVVWPVARILTLLHAVGDDSRRYEIDSFKSYEGVSSKNIVTGPAFVIISASTSGGLEAKLKEILGSPRVEVWTILGLESDRASGDDEERGPSRNEIFILPRKLKGHPALGGLREKFEPDVPSIPPGTEAVRVIGERFLSHNVRPKLVRLAHRSLDARYKIDLANAARDGLLLTARRRPDGKSWWSVSFDLRALVRKYTEESVNGRSHLENWLMNYSFPGPVLIVYPPDSENGGGRDEGQGELLAHRAQGLLLRFAKEQSDVRVADSRELDRPDAALMEFLATAGVLVIAPVIGNGFVFKQISAALRNLKPVGPRLYIALAVLPESQARLSELKADLESNAEDSAYRFKHGLAIPIGRIDETSQWNREFSLLNEVRDYCADNQIDMPRRFIQRLESLASGTCLDGELAYLPTMKGDPQPLSAGFLLWTSERPIAGATYGSAVLFTMAAFLEACRAARSGVSETSLISGLFQQTLISPANFTRFNDPAIQAALLRSAYDSEMDYAASVEASYDMSQLIQKLIHLSDAPAGAAVAEFLLALAVGRLKLERTHHADVLKSAAAQLTGWLAALAAKIPSP